MKKLLLLTIVPFLFCQNSFARSDRFSAAEAYKSVGAPRTADCRFDSVIDDLVYEAVSRCMEDGYSQNTCEKGRTSVRDGYWVKVQGAAFHRDGTVTAHDSNTWLCRVEVNLVITF